MSYPRLHTEAYSFSIEHGEGTTITLTQTATGKTKVFFLAGVRPVEPLTDHLNSLTDDLCSQWFNERERKPKKEKQ